MIVTICFDNSRELGLSETSSKVSKEHADQAAKQGMYIYTSCVGHSYCIHLLILYADLRCRVCWGRDGRICSNHFYTEELLINEHILDY